MAYKPYPRCKKLIPHGMAYCLACKPIVEQAVQEKRQHNKSMRQKRYNSRRNQKYVKFYHSKDWKNLSRYKLEQVGWKCEAHLDDRCTGVAVEVHHIRPIQTEEGWHLPDSKYPQRNHEPYAIPLKYHGRICPFHSRKNSDVSLWW